MTQLLKLRKAEGDASWHGSASVKKLKNLSVWLCSLVERRDTLKDPIFKVLESFCYPYSQQKIKSHLRTASGVD